MTALLAAINGLLEADRMLNNDFEWPAREGSHPISLFERFRVDILT